MSDAAQNAEATVSPLRLVHMASRPEQVLEILGTIEAQVKLFAAIATARAEFEPVIKGRLGQVGNGRFPYADLATLANASLPALSKHGVSVMQPLTSSPFEGHDRLTTIVSGHGAQIVGRYDFKRLANPQEFGRVSTYLRRYAFNALFVLDGEPDADEAPREDGQGPRREPAKPPAPAKPEPARAAPAAAAPKAASAMTTAKPAQYEVPAHVTASAEVAKQYAAKPAVAEGDGPTTSEQEQRLVKLVQDLGLGRVRFSGLCMEWVGIAPNQLNTSRVASAKVFENLQRMKLDADANGARP